MSKPAARYHARNFFQYYDETGERKSIDSGDVNQYIKESTQQGFTRKGFQTVGGLPQYA